MGATTLLIGVVVESLTYTIDQWLLGALVVMVIAKTAKTLYDRKNY